MQGIKHLEWYRNKSGLSMFSEEKNREYGVQYTCR